MVLTEQRERILIITINRPEAKNAVNAAVSQGLADAMDRLDGDTGLSVAILTGAGGSFCAGMDLKAFARGENVVVKGRGMGFTERPPAKPVIAAVEGYALAGGTELALACDLIVASKESAFGIPEVKRGLVAGGGACCGFRSASPTGSPWSWRSPVTTFPRNGRKRLDWSTCWPSRARRSTKQSSSPRRSPPTAAGGGRHQANHRGVSRLEPGHHVRRAAEDPDAGVRLQRCQRRRGRIRRETPATLDRHVNARSRWEFATPRKIRQSSKARLNRPDR
ncbi:enoyl-CoA hydratase EchA1 [Mycobacterium xenopi 4042]|uniref:Enoyl-CoA hydratase EchA1 n=1 Tax=Mycobacterium xenopi 4042 TaxID=1299334 RepID=X7Z9T2_MYCXE|nr:enoyl-CoA hydratase EchA1 [Mycobacterium xenopi 4042]